MNLTELQIEIKEVEKHLSSIRSEIEKLKPNKEEGIIDFDYITELAKKHPLTHLKIKDASSVLKNDFIKGLSYLLLNEEREIYEGLLYITRLSVGLDLQIASQEIYMEGLSFEKKDLYNICNNIEDYKYSFLIESCIIANLSEDYAASKLPVIAQFAEIMGCDKEDVLIISHIAKSKLIGDLSVLDNITPPSQNKYSKKFDEYLSQTWLQYKRKECAKLCVGKKSKYSSGNSSPYSKSALFWAASGNSSNNSIQICKINNREPAGKVVKKGDIILTYKIDNSNEKRLISEYDGVVYFIKNQELKSGTEYTYMYVYVVSYFDDYESFEKWFRGKNNNK